MTHSFKSINTPPPPEEMALRMKRVRALMQREKLDYYVIANIENVYYLTNFTYIPFERPFFLIVPFEGKPVMIVPLLEVSHAQDRVLIDVDYQTYYEYPSPPARAYEGVLKKVVPDKKRIGIESSLSIASEKVIPGNLKVIDIVDEARIVKTDYEVGRIIYASEVADIGMSKIVEMSRPEIEEFLLYGDGSKEMTAKVVLEVPGVNMLVSKFTCAVWPKALSAQPHSVPHAFDKLEKGGPNIAIIAVQVDGYSAEVERTYFLGHMPEEAKKPFDVSMEARDLAFQLIKHGVSAAEVDEKVLDVIIKSGYEKNILHRTGHGFGITGHEPPWIALGSTNILEKNMVVSIEPGIYIPEIGGFRHSDTVLITTDGCESLTKSPDKPEDLILPIE